jgi:hypothetical protein
MSDKPDTLASALAAFQAELPRLGKGNTADAGTYKYKYADLADVSMVVLPLLGKHGLSFSAKPTLDATGKFVLEYALRHAGGESDGGVYPLPTGRPQEVGSAITYARRYALSAMTGIAPDGDDDGATAPDVPDVRYDPIEQDVLRHGWEAEIADAADEAALKEIGRKLLVAKRSREISPATYAHLANAGAARMAELNGATRAK